MKTHRLQRLSRLTQGAAVLSLGVLATGCHETPPNPGVPHHVNSPPPDSPHPPGDPTAPPTPSAAPSASSSAAVGPGAPPRLNSPNTPSPPSSAPPAPFPGTMNVRHADPPPPTPTK